MTHSEFAIIVVTYQSGAEIGACLDAARGTGAEIVVVDNGSGDDTVGEVRRRGVRLFENRANRGFAAAVNQGVRATTAPLLLLLNPDAVIQGGVELLAGACSRPNTGIAGGRLVDECGRPQIGFVVRRFPRPVVLAMETLLVNRLWPRNPLNWHYRCLGMDHASPGEVDQPAGAFLMFRRELWERLGGFDEGFYPLWFEDVDFCLRARQVGYHAYYVPGAVAKHTGAHSVRKISLESRQLYWYGSLLRYASKHFSSAEARGLCLIVIAGSVLRFLAGIIYQRSLEPLVVYSKVIRTAGRHFLHGA